ncbi:unnamed protein product [Sphenostylis stenocarpa]|uniref:Uncharacterized protein n=1 Tax=Sphenostylis stenocarpa TaxID=92480 RepID=A0AA86T4L4_9FABA|nr:unnamed protein product [Sphenostylis stenocarpa]
MYTVAYNFLDVILETTNPQLRSLLNLIELFFGSGEESTARRRNLQTKAGMTSAGESVTEILRRLQSERESLLRLVQFVDYLIHYISSALIRRLKETEAHLSNQLDVNIKGTSLRCREDEISSPLSNVMMSWTSYCGHKSCYGGTGRAKDHKLLQMT